MKLHVPAKSLIALKNIANVLMKASNAVSCVDVRIAGISLMKEMMLKNLNS